MSTATVTVGQLIEQATEELRGPKRRMFERHLRRNAKARQELEDRVLLELSTDPRAQAILGADMCLGFGNGTLTADTPFQIDTDKLRELLDLILEYAPKFIELLLKILPLFMSLLFLLVLGGISHGQEYPIRIVERSGVVATNSYRVLGDGSLVRIVAQPVAVTASTTRVVATVAEPYRGRWPNNDGRTFRQHAVEVHGFDPRLSTAELTRLHEAYHDRFGGHPPTPASSLRYRSSTVTRSCPPGGCPVNNTRQRFRLFRK